ncbi:Hypothetical protein CINCED_3A018009 [Cinara cedri]|uniref:DUF4371 domain-containing protein n=1 Tax=Cinara cedri TaxID=506608 RepID=A0A5E4MDN7_9HEMI|nr:Hypothetical protein CINCED_3A018009 [Cinara cedri]
MNGAYNGLQAHMKNSNPLIVYTHCLAYVLNLIMEDSTKKIVEPENIFGLVEQTAVFLSDSFKRMESFTEKDTSWSATATDKSRNITSFNKFKYMVFFIIDNLEISISERFIPNEQLMKDYGWLDPKKYCDLQAVNEIPDNVFSEITKLANVERSAVLTELNQFANYYHSIILEHLMNILGQDKENEIIKNSVSE